MSWSATCAAAVSPRPRAPRSGAAAGTTRRSSPRPCPDRRASTPGPRPTPRPHAGATGSRPAAPMARAANPMRSRAARDRSGWRPCHADAPVQPSDGRHQRDARGRQRPAVRRGQHQRDVGVPGEEHPGEQSAGGDDGRDAAAAPEDACGQQPAQRRHQRGQRAGGDRRAERAGVLRRPAHGRDAERRRPQRRRRGRGRSPQAGRAAQPAHAAGRPGRTRPRRPGRARGTPSATSSRSVTSPPPAARPATAAPRPPDISPNTAGAPAPGRPPRSSR